MVDNEGTVMPQPTLIDMEKRSVIVAPGGGVSYLDSLKMATLYFDKVYNPYYNPAHFLLYKVTEKLGLEQIIENYKEKTRIYFETYESIKPLYDEKLIESGLNLFIPTADRIDWIKANPKLSDFNDLLLESVSSLEFDFSDIFFQYATQDSKDSEPILYNDLRAATHGVALLNLLVNSTLLDAPCLTLSSETLRAYQALVEADILKTKQNIPKIKENAVAFITLSRSLPYLKGLNSEQILSLREKTQPLAQNMSVYINKITAESNSDIEYNEYNSWANEIVKKEIDPLLHELEVEIDNFNNRTIRKLASNLRSSLMAVSVPFLINVLTHVPVGDVTLGGLGILLGTTILEERLSLNEKIQQSPVSFLLKVKEASQKHA